MASKTGGGPVENQYLSRIIPGAALLFRYADVVSANIKVTADSQVTLWLFNKANTWQESTRVKPDRQHRYSEMIETNSNFSANKQMR